MLSTCNAIIICQMFIILYKTLKIQCNTVLPLVILCKTYKISCKTPIILCETPLMSIELPWPVRSHFVNKDWPMTTSHIINNLF